MVQECRAGLRQAFELTPERTCRGKTTAETIYGITSLSLENAHAPKLLESIREHWRIENSLHYVHDVKLGEEACRVHKRAASQGWRPCGM